MAKILYLALFAALMGTVMSEGDFSEEDYTAIDDLDQRILGGTRAPAELFPYHVSLQARPTPKRLKKVCGGVIIASNWALTAAHCVVADPSNGTQLFVNAGVTYAFNYDRSKSQFIKVTETILHPEYDRAANISANDIALLKLATNIKPNKHVQAIALPPNADFNIKREGIIMGFGATGFPTPEHLTDHLMYAHIDLTPNPDKFDILFNCTLGGPTFGDSQICMDRLSGTAACQGDSGSPFVIIDNDIPILAGISSYGNRDCRKFPSVYTKVSHFLGWIQDVTKITFNADTDYE